MTTIFDSKYPDYGMLSYLETMVGKIFKILPLYEESQDEAFVYVENFVRELIGAEHLILEVGRDPDFVSMVCTIYGIVGIRENKAAVRSDVFKSIQLCSRVKERFKNGLEGANGD